MEHLNVFSLILATLTPTVMGFLYYSKWLFGKAWMQSIGMTEEKQKEANMPVVISISLVMAFLLSFFMVGFCNDVGQEGQFDTFKHGAWHGAFLSVFVIIPVLVTNGLFEQRSWKNMLINSLYWLITLALMGGIIDAMNHFPNVVE